MKTVIAPFFDGIIARNVLYTDVLPRLRSEGIRLLIIPPEGKEELYREKFDDGVMVRVLPTGSLWKPTFFDSVILNLFLQSIPTRFMRIRQVDWYWHQKKYIHYYAASALRFLGRFYWYRTCIRYLALLQPVRKEIRTLFDEWNPDAVFAPTMIAPLEVGLLRLAKSKGKTTIGMAKSWDNFTSKAFIRVFPDWIIVHNRLQIDEAAQLFDYPKDRIFVSGIPQMDRYQDPSFMEPRAAFCKKLGLDPEKRIILYAPAGDWMNPYDKETLERILDWIEGGEIADCQVLLRLHPGYHSRTEELKGRKHLVVERPGKHFGTRLKSVEFDQDDIHHLANSLHHAAVIIHTASTIGMEAAYLDRPVIHLGFDGNNQLPYWKSVRRYYDREHCVPFVTLGGGRLVQNPEELLKSLNMYLNDPTVDYEGRQRLAQLLCYSFDGKAGERIGSFIAEKVKQ